MPFPTHTALSTFPFSNGASTTTSSFSLIQHTKEENGKASSVSFHILPPTLSPPPLPLNSKNPFNFIIKYLFMGAGISLSTSNKYDDDDGDGRPGLGDIPESCISRLLMNLDPPEICQLARVNRAFHRASSADFVWESKLPQTYKFLAKKVFAQHNIIASMTKKDIYTKLCLPNRFDAGTKEVWLDKCSGQICLFMSSKSFNITGIDDRRYWNYIPTEESRFKSVAYLQQMWWVEVVGELEFEFPVGSYTLFFRLQLGMASKRKGRRVCNVDQVHGWDIKPVRFQLSTSHGHLSHSESYLTSPGEWIHYRVGDFIVDRPNEPTKLKFSLAQIDCTHTKGGLCIDGAIICPTQFSHKIILF